MKAVAVPYIVAIVLGIAVIGLLGYWFFVQSGKTGTTGTKAECDSKLASFCLSWKSLGGKSDNKPTIDWGNCPKRESESDCKSIGISIP